MFETKSRYIILTICYICSIFYISSLPDSSLTMGDSTLEKNLWNLAHIPLYGVLAIFLYLTFRKRKKINNSFLKLNWIVFIIALFIASLDELNQSHVPGRSASLLDIFFDSIGIITALWIITIIESKGEVKV